MSKELINPFRKGLIRNLFLFLVIGIVISSIFLSFKEFDEFDDNIFNGLFHLLEFILIIILLKKYKLEIKYLIGDYKEITLPKIIENISIASYFFTFVISFNFIYSYIFNATNSNDISFLKDLIIEQNKFDFYNIFNNIDKFILFCVLSPIIEEISFRGLILHRLAIKWNTKKSILICSLFFGILHGYKFLYISIFGYILSIIYLKEKKLIYPILFHSLYNFLILFFSIFLSNYYYFSSNPTLEILVFSLLLAFSSYKIFYFLKNNPPKNIEVNELPYFSNYSNINKTDINIIYQDFSNPKVKKIVTYSLIIFPLILLLSLFLVNLEYHIFFGKKISEKQVNKHTTGDQKNPSIASYYDKNFIVWQSENQDGDNWGIYGRNIELDYDGKNLTDDILINQTKTGKQENPSVENIDDKFIVTWNGNGNGDNEGIYARFFDEKGKPLTNEFKVNDNTDNIQSEPKIIKTIDCACNFYIAWKNEFEHSISIKEYSSKDNKENEKERKIFLPKNIDFQTIKFSSLEEYILLLAKKDEKIYLYTLSLEDETFDEVSIVSNNGNNPSITSDYHNIIVSWEEFDKLTNKYYLKVKKYHNDIDEDKSIKLIHKEDENKAFLKPVSYLVNDKITSIWEFEDITLEKNIFTSSFYLVERFLFSIKDYGIKLEGDELKKNDFQVNIYGYGNQTNFNSYYANLSDNKNKKKDNGYFGIVWESEYQDGDKKGIFFKIIIND
ncbi:MAG: CPBP family intramembrane glutamic endopeptidase [Cyanobacteriota bacterium]